MKNRIRWSYCSVFASVGIACLQCHCLSWRVSGASAPQRIIIENSPTKPPQYRYDDRSAEGMPARRALVDPKLEAAVRARFMEMTAKSKLAPLRVKIQVDLGIQAGASPSREDLLVQKNVERLFGQTLRAAGVQIVNQRHNILLKLIVAGRSIETGTVSGASAEPIIAPDIAVEALRADNDDVLGQVSTAEFLVNKRTAAQVVRICGSDAVIKATALALMEDMLTMDPNQPGLDVVVNPPAGAVVPAETIPVPPAPVTASGKTGSDGSKPVETRPLENRATNAPANSVETKPTDGGSAVPGPRADAGGLDEDRLRVTAAYLKDAVERLLSSEQAKP